jgi:hypothetical protein
MAEIDGCRLCGARDSWRHALLDCSMARCVWALVEVEIIEHLHCFEEGRAREWLATLRHEDQVKVFVTL